MESKFTGKLSGLIGINIAQFFIILFTVGLGVPWAVCKKQRWITSHTIVDGKQLQFDGHGGGLFGQYFKWLLLSVITVGIYSLWIPIKMQKWIAEHTHFVSSGEKVTAASSAPAASAPVSAPAVSKEEPVGPKKCIRCPNCKGVIEVNEAEPAIHCLSCGKSYKNPYHKK